MIIDNNEIKNKNINSLEYVNEHWTLYLEGFLYIDGKISGIDSLKYFVELLNKIGLEKSILKLRGNYFLHLENKIDKIKYSFIDSNGLYKVFYNNSHISTDFDKIIDHSKDNDLSINSLSIVELFHYGKTSKDNTLFNGINKLQYNEIILNIDGGKNEIQKKNIPEIYDALDDFDLNFYFKNLAFALQNYKVSLDLTGGMDTRMLAVILDHYNLDFEVAISGYDGHPDVEIAKKVAKSLGKELKVSYHNLDNIENELEELCELVDYSTNIFSHHRLLQLQRDRISRGYNMVISGSGDIMSDNIWLQDFPFYGIKKPNIPKLFDYRFISLNQKHDYLMQPFKNISLSYRETIIAKLLKFSLDNNTKTYDYIQHRYRMQETIGRSISNNMKFIHTYTPLMELDILRYGFQFPIRKRLFNNFQKQIISKLNPKVSVIKTTENGVTASTKFEYFSVDLIKFFIDRGKRALNQVSRKILNKNFTPPIADISELNSFQKKYIIENKVLKHFRDLNIISDSVNFSNLEPRYYGNIITVSLFLKRFNSYPIN